MSNVHEFHPVIVGEGYRFEPDKILEGAKGQPFTTLVILGSMEDGTTWVSSTTNAGEALVLIERAKHQIVFPET